MGVVRGLCVGFVSILAAFPAFVLAHDIPNARVDRAIQVDVHPGRIEIDYEVSLSELTLAQDLRNLIGSLPGSDRQALFERYGQETGPLNAKGLWVFVDGREIALTETGFSLAVEEHPRFTFHFEASLPPQGLLKVQDTNYAGSEGTSRLALRSHSGVSIKGNDGPTNVQDVPVRPVWQLNDAEERRTRQIEVTFATSAGSAPVALPSVPSREEPPSTVSIAPDQSPTPVRSKPTSLSRLLDRAGGLSIFGLWLIALGLGAAHAIQPGHGKTLVASAVVGERGGWLAGVGLALVTTAAHFASVLLIAALIWLTHSRRYESINTTLAQVAGFVIATVGLWRIGRHLGGFGEHEGDQEPATIGTRGILGLGVAGGLVPCWDAVVLVVLADLAGKLALGLILLSGFSLGMAAVLVGVGLAAARLRRMVVGFDQEGRWERRLGLASGFVLSAIGLSLLLGS